MKILLWLTPLKKKKILVIGDDESCQEIIDELRPKRARKGNWMDHDSAAKE